MRLDPDGYVVIGRVPEGRLVLGPTRREFDGELVVIDLVLQAQGVRAQGVIEVEQWGGGPKGLIEYFAALASQWQGWAGDLPWSDDHANVEIKARHDGVGKVQIECSVRHGYGDPGSWILTAQVLVEPGELEGIAAALESLLANQ